jgi:hypothetical protein
MAVRSVLARCLSAPLRAAALAVVVAGGALSAATAPFTMPDSFHADVEAKMQGQQMAFALTSDGPDRQRMDTTAMGMATIIRKDQKKIYLLMTANRQVMTMPYNPAMAQNALGFTDDKDATWTRGADATVRGIACEVWTITSKNGTMTCYVRADHTPVRVESKDGGVTDFISFTPGKQDAALFEPPVGWTVAETPAGMGGMMGQ